MIKKPADGLAHVVGHELMAGFFRLAGRHYLGGRHGARRDQKHEIGSHSAKRLNKLEYRQSLSDTGGMEPYQGTVGTSERRHAQPLAAAVLVLLAAL